MKKLFALLLTLASIASSVVSFAVPASAANTVEAPTASLKSGFYVYGDIAKPCGHTKEIPGYHVGYSLYTYSRQPEYCTSKEERKACLNKTAYKFSDICTGTNTISVSLSTPTKGATIYFDMETTEDELRKETDIKYSVPIDIARDTKITAYAVKNGVRSKSVTYSYRIGQSVYFSHESGTYENPINISISETETGMRLHNVGKYTTDGSDPRTSPTAMEPDTTIGAMPGFYNAYYYIDRTCTFKVHIKGVEGQTGYVATKKYVIQNGDSKPTPTASNEDIRESDLYDYRNKYYYKRLNFVQKQLYAKKFKYYLDEINGKTPNYKASIFTLSDSKTDEVTWALRQENPQFNFTLKNVSSTLITSEHLNDELERAALEILNEANKLSSDYEKVKYFHDTIINNTTYTTFTNNHQTAYGALVDKKAVCRGYANAFAYLCQAANISCVVVSGEGKTTAHAWNIVKLNGNWYHVDTLWDHTKNGIRYDYFLVSEEQIRKDHKISNDIFIPKAPSNYRKSVSR